MSGAVLTFPRKASRLDQPHPIAPIGGDVFVIDGQGGGFVVYDESPSGGSAGIHGDFDDHAQAVRVGKQVAERINARSFQDLSKGGA